MPTAYGAAGTDRPQCPSRGSDRRPGGHRDRRVAAPLTTTATPRSRRPTRRRPDAGHHCAAPIRPAASGPSGDRRGAPPTVTPTAHTTVAAHRRAASPQRRAPPGRRRPPLFETSCTGCGRAHDRSRTASRRLGNLGRAEGCDPDRAAVERADLVAVESHPPPGGRPDRLRDSALVGGQDEVDGAGAWPRRQSGEVAGLVAEIGGAVIATPSARVPEMLRACCWSAMTFCRNDLPDACGARDRGQHSSVAATASCWWWRERGVADPTATAHRDLIDELCVVVRHDRKCIGAGRRYIDHRRCSSATPRAAHPDSGSHHDVTEYYDKSR